MATRKKMEYQRDLMQQIEDKKNELKAIKRRDQIEEEKLTKYVDEQNEISDAVAQRRADVAGGGGNGGEGGGSGHGHSNGFVRRFTNDNSQH